MTARVSLRDVIESDLPVFFEHQKDPEAVRMAEFPSRERDAFMAHWTRILADATLVKKTVLLDGQVAGNIVCFDREGLREIGYWIGREHWGQGAASEALKQLLHEMPERPLYATVASHNVASVRVLQKCGFKEVPQAKHKGPDGVEEIVLRLDE